MELKEIDINHSFTEDTPEFWDGFWEHNGGMGAGKNDPDSKSKILRKYHQLLWSRKLPNGEFMHLEEKGSCLLWKEKDLWLSSDSIIVSFRNSRFKDIIEQVAASMDDYKSYVEEYVRRTYTIGGMIIFPIMRNSINQRKGCSWYICDRWDLTLECIRRFYANEQSPLTSCLERNKEFFELFVDFKGYVDYFFLQDCVSEDYKSVDVWYGDNSMIKTKPYPKTVKDYITFIDKEVEFMNNRNQRIKNFISSNEAL